MPWSREVGMHWLMLLLAIVVCLALSLLLSVFFHTFIFLAFLPLVFMPLTIGARGGRH